MGIVERSGYDPLQLRAHPLATLAGACATLCESSSLSGSSRAPSSTPGPQKRLRAIELDGQTILERDYDEHGRLSTVHFPKGKADRFGWSDHGPANVLLASGRAIRFVYDSLGRLASIAYAGGRRLSFDRADDKSWWSYAFPSDVDATGSVNIAFGEEGSTRTTSADAVFDFRGGSPGHLQLKLADTSHGYEYNGRGFSFDFTTRAVGLETQAVSALGIWNYRNGLAVSTILPDGRRLLLRRHGSSRLFQEWSPEGQAGFVSSDGRGLSERIDPAGHRTVFHEVEDAILAVGTGGVQVCRHNRRGQLECIVDPSGTSISMKYDQHRRLARVASESGSYAFGYDRQGRLCSLRSSSGLACGIQYSDKSAVVPSRVRMKRLNKTLLQSAVELGVLWWRWHVLAPAVGLLTRGEPR